MKKYLLLIVFALAASVLPAQNGDMYSLMFHDKGGNQCNIENFMQQHDGDFIFATFVATPWTPSNPGIPLGNIFYKMSPSTLTITDSLFVDDPDAPYYLFAPNPNGEGNIRANFEYDEESDSTFLRICHFPDNDLNINHDEDIMVPVCDGYAWGNFDSHMVDCRGDLIMKYSTMRPEGGYDEYIARFSPEGILMHQALLFENKDIVIPKLRVLKESPLQYYQWRGYYDDNLAVFVIDTLFNKNTVVINKILSEVELDSVPFTSVYERLEFNIDTEVIPAGGDNILVAARYSNDTTWHYMGEMGVAVAKFDLRTMQLKDYIVFNDYPGWTREGNCMGLKKMSDGTVYFMYKELGYPAESVIVVKMDVDLNVEWKRFCKTDNISLLSPLSFSNFYIDEQGEEKGIAWAGGGIRTDTDDKGLICFILNHDGTVGVNESNIEVRPYCFYPNPVQAQLQMQFSPDVQPKQIELYDLQGRLVRVQRSSFGSIDMSRLPAGAYMLRVTLEDEKVFSDKVVKE
ncbi:MAG: T9SS type A sorting domain-containing protein [Bacteroidales bacterium]|nr:T9SS type A sorting domain-containing protein [Bacteroidales bacterium]